MYREIEGEDVILEKDPTYVLTVADIEQYASWLGMDLELDAGSASRSWRRVGGSGSRCGRFRR